MSFANRIHTNRTRGRLVGTQGAGGALLGAAAGARTDDGSPRTRLAKTRPVTRGRFRRVLLGITNGGKLGLGVAAGLFIVFALLCSFYFSRRNPDFPGNRLGAFVAVTVVLFAVTMAGVWVFAAEEEAEGHAAERRRRPVPTRDRREPPGRRPRQAARPRATRRPARPSSPRRGAAAATRSRPRAPRVRSGRTSTRRSRTRRSSSTGSPTARGSCPRSATSSASSRSRTSPRTWSRPRRASRCGGYPSLARRGVRAAEGARLEIA